MLHSGVMTCSPGHQMDTEYRGLTTAFELAAAAAELLRQVRDELAALRREQGDLGIEIFERLDNLAARARPMTDHSGAWLAALRRGWGTLPFTCSALIGWAKQGATAQQREVLDATRALCRLQAGADLTTAKLSAALRRLPPGQVEVAGDRRGSILWALRDLRD